MKARWHSVGVRANWFDEAWNSCRFAARFCPVVLVLTPRGPARPANRPSAQPVLARHGMVVAQEAQAARIGIDDPASQRRQRGRCRGRDRLRAGGDLSARGQYRRRRLHGDPPCRRPPRYRDRLPRDRAGRDHARHLSRATRARPTRRNRAIAGLRSACPARSRALRSRTANTDPAASRSRN